MSRLRELLASIEHDQWISWSKALVATELLSPERIERWKSLWVPYDELSECDKQSDRDWADVVLDVIDIERPVRVEP